MYGWIFRHLPGPLWARVALSLVLLAGVLVLLIQFAFPWIADVTNLTDATVG